MIPMAQLSNQEIVARPKTPTVKVIPARIAKMIIVFPLVVVMTPVYQGGLTMVKLYEHTLM